MGLTRPQGKSRADTRQPAEPGLAVPRPVVGPQEIGAELAEARAADLAHDQVDFAAEDVDHLVDAGDIASTLEEATQLTTATP